MTDIARLVGVSQSCVSLVLNEAPGARMSEATRQLVLEAANRLGYRLPGRREPAAMSTRSVIAYVVDEVSISPHPVLHIDGARDAAWAHECTVQVHVTRSNKALEAATIAAISRDQAVAGLIYATSFTREVELPTLPAAMPVVLLNCYVTDRRYPALLPGEVAGGFAATEHLLSHHHRRIAMIGGEPWMDAARDRLKGYRQALATANIGFDPALVREGEWSADSGYNHTLELMQLPTPPTAFFCASDMMALGCLDALSELGISVPADVSVIGYNDLELTRHTRPPLSSCRVPNDDMASRAVEILLDAAWHSKQARPAVTRFECQIVARSSVSNRKGFRAVASRQRAQSDGDSDFVAV